MKQKLKGIIGIAIMLIALVATYLWVSYGQERLESVTLLVAQKDIPKGTVIDDANKYFIPARISLNSAVSGAIKPENESELNGRIAEQFIPANGQIVAQTFSNDSVVLKEGEFVFKLPPTWVYSVPSSIRRGDRISIYEIDGKLDSNVNSAENPKVALTPGQANSILDTTAVFVKDSTNREVVDTNGNDRLDGSSQVSAIEIVCTRKDTQILESTVLNGKKLIVVYR